MSAEPLVSILIPVYNRELLVGVALESALAQTYPNVEIVVVDNCSSDRTYDVVQEYARRDGRVRAFRNDENLGAVRNWIKCFEYSTGAFVKLLFSDDWLAPEAIARYVQPLRDQPHVGFSFSATDLHFDNGQIWQLYRLGESRILSSIEFLTRTLTARHVMPVSPGCALFRRADVERGLVAQIPDRLGLDCGSKGIGPDLLLFLRACDEYPSLFYIADVLSHFKAHRDSITGIYDVAIPGLTEICYDVAFSGFLATAKLPARQKHRLNALLFMRSFSRGRLRAAKCRTPWQLYRRMFPQQPSYGYWRMNPLFRQAFDLVRRRVTERLRA